MSIRLWFILSLIGAMLINVQAAHAREWSDKDYNYKEWFVPGTAIPGECKNLPGLERVAGVCNCCNDVGSEITREWASKAGIETMAGLSAEAGFDIIGVKAKVGVSFSVGASYETSVKTTLVWVCPARQYTVAWLQWTRQKYTTGVKHYKSRQKKNTKGKPFTYHNDEHGVKWHIDSPTALPKKGICPTHHH